MKRPHGIYFFIAVVAAATTLSYIYGWFTLPTDGTTWVRDRDTVVVVEVSRESNGEKAGLIVGDKIVSVAGHSAEVGIYVQTLWRYFSVGQVVEYRIVRNDAPLRMTVELQSAWSVAPVSYFLYYVLIFFTIAVGMIVLLKRPDDPSVIIFFIFTQCFSLTITGGSPTALNVLGLVHEELFIVAFCYVGPTLVHFFLLFPNRHRLLSRFPFMPRVLYGATLSFFIFAEVTTASLFLSGSKQPETSASIAYGLGSIWMGANLLTAIILASLRFFKDREPLHKDQLRLVMVGVSMGLSPYVLFGFIPWLAWYLMAHHQPLFHLILGAGASVFVASTSLAIFRYRLWDIEPIIRRSFLYATMTGSIVGAYALLGYVFDLFIPGHTEIVHLGGVALVALLFLPLRDLLQKRIDRAFHRESYNPIEVVKDFERSLQGIYDTNRLHQAMIQAIDNVLHFTSFFLLRTESDGGFATVGNVGTPANIHLQQVSFPKDLGRHLRLPNIISATELWTEFPVFAEHGIELLIPICSGDECKGIFLCGPKRSEKRYSLHDIHLLTGLAQSSAMLLRTAEFYEREQRSSQEFSRQLIASQEADRKRVAGELHDNLGQELMVIINRAHIGIKRSTDDASKAEFHEIARAASLGIEQVREMAYDLSPYHLEQLGLIEVLKSMVEKISTVSTTAFRMDVDAAPWRFSKAEDMNIYRIVQECINNIVKHSAASRAEISFKQSNGHLEVIVRDNGKGFNVETGPVSQGARRGFGLAGLSERINLLHGSLAIESTPHHGTAITIRIPFCNNGETQ